MSLIIYIGQKCFLQKYMLQNNKKMHTYKKESTIIMVHFVLLRKFSIQNKKINCHI